MSYGVEIYDASGNLIVNMASRLVKFIALVNTGTTNNSYSDARLTGKNIVVHIMPTTSFDKAYTPKLTIPTAGSGLNTVSWTFDGGLDMDIYPCELAIGYI